MMDITKIGGKKSQKTPGSYIRPIYIGIYPEIETVPLRFASENRNVLYSTPGIIRSYVYDRGVLKSVETYHPTAHN
jgi:hypothetical protein